MKLRECLGDETVLDEQSGAREVTGVALDSRHVKPGDVFFALTGVRTDGSRFVAQAVASGAVAVVTGQRLEIAIPVPVIVTSNPRRALALAAARMFPRQPPVIAAVTGTSGKTSVAAFTRQIWEREGFSSASVGTIGLVSRKRTVYGSLTTPDPISLHQTLHDIAGEGVTHLALEASSHGLDQHRLDGVRVTAAAFTNLSRDHMDYHPTVEHYLGAKLRLFTDLVMADGSAVVVADHEHSQTVIEAARRRELRVMTVGRKGSDLKLIDARIDGFGQQLKVECEGCIRDLRLPLVGEFQIENALVSAGLAIATGSDADGVLAALETLEGAKGRLELVGERNGAAVFVDYAHKPDALEKALAAVRPYARRKLAVVFGAGGDRDAGKRAVMGAIASAQADDVIVTDDNPRSEDPALIRAAILGAAPGAREIGDRAEAIRVAVSELQPGDALIIAGKGHETGQIVGDTTLPFSDHDAAAAALAEYAA